MAPWRHRGIWAINSAMYLTRCDVRCGGTNMLSGF
ncbi:MAG: hypothetical protein ACI85K_000732 [Hyphomicrobiaceae bacterium]|jgi:hypothetical protein